MFFPWKVMKPLEENEKDSFTNIEKIPILGAIVTGIKGFGTIFEKLFD